MNEEDDENGKRNAIVGVFYGFLIILITCGVLYAIYAILKCLLSL